MTEEDIRILNAYIESKKNKQEEHKSRFDDVKEERKVAELAILNDTLALIYDYISEKK